jgi:hypothetical protein
MTADDKADTVDPKDAEEKTEKLLPAFNVEPTDKAPVTSNASNIVDVPKTVIGPTTDRDASCGMRAAPLIDKELPQRTNDATERLLPIVLLPNTLKDEYKIAACITVRPQPTVALDVTLNCKPTCVEPRADNIASTKAVLAALNAPCSSVEP